MLVKTTHSSNGPGMIPSYWEEFFDVNGNPLTQREASDRRKRANQKFKGRHGQLVTKKNNYRASFSKSFWSEALKQQFAKSKAMDDISDHMADSMRYMVDSAVFSDTMKIMRPEHLITPKVTA